MAETVFTKQNDMTGGPEWKRLLLFALPIMAGQFLQQLYNTVDGIVVGNYVSDAALGSVGACTTLAFLFLAFAFGFGNGCGVVIAQLYGARRWEDLRAAASTALLLLSAMGVVSLLVGFFGTHWFVTGLMKVQGEELIALAETYFSIYSLGLLFQFLYNCVASILRAVGDSRATLYFLCVSAVLNLLLDLLFVAKFRWGVAGAAVATVLSQFVCVVVCFVYMFGRYPVFRFRKGEFRYDRTQALLCLKMGLPLTMQQCIVSFGNVFMQRLVNHFGRATMAAFTAGVRIENYCMIPALSLNSAVSMFTGQNIGAGRLDRVRRGWKSAVLLAIGITGAIAAGLYAFATPLAGLFGVEGEALAQAVEYVRFISFMMVIFAVYQSTVGLIQGSGDALYSTFCSLTTLTTRVSLAYILVFCFDFGYSVIWHTVPVGWVMGMILALLRYRAGTWKKKAIVGGKDLE